VGVVYLINEVVLLVPYVYLIFMNSASESVENVTLNSNIVVGTIRVTTRLIFRKATIPSLMTVGKSQSGWYCCPALSARLWPERNHIYTGITVLLNRFR